MRIYVFPVLGTWPLYAKTITSWKPKSSRGNGRNKRRRREKREKQRVGWVERKSNENSCSFSGERFTLNGTVKAQKTKIKHVQFHVDSSTNYCQTLRRSIDSVINAHNQWQLKFKAVHAFGATFAELCRGVRHGRLPKQRNFLGTSPWELDNLENEADNT